MGQTKEYIINQALKVNLEDTAVKVKISDQAKHYPELLFAGLIYGGFNNGNGLNQAHVAAMGIAAFIEELEQKSLKVRNKGQEREVQLINLEAELKRNEFKHMAVQDLVQEIIKETVSETCITDEQMLIEQDRSWEEHLRRVKEYPTIRISKDMIKQTLWSIPLEQGMTDYVCIDRQE